MAISPIALNAYRSAMSLSGTGGTSSVTQQVNRALGGGKPQGSGFMETLQKSVSEVNAEQIKKDNMVEAFATGENQNVHELMIQLQKAGMAMSMTTAVRGKVMDMYRELIKMPF